MESFDAAYKLHLTLRADVGVRIAAFRLEPVSGEQLPEPTSRFVNLTIMPVSDSVLCFDKDSPRQFCSYLRGSTSTVVVEAEAKDAYA